MVYRIWMKEVVDLPEGWFCGLGKRINASFYRTENKRDADTFDSDESAVLFAAEHKRYGYDCEVVPKVSNKRIVEILF